VERAEFLALTNLTPKAFETLSHKKFLPFTPNRPTPTGWAKYSLWEALLMELMLRHMDEGLEREAACALLRSVGEDLAEALAGSAAALEDIYAGYVPIRSSRAPDEPSATLRHPVVGSLSQLAGSMDDLRSRVRGTIDGLFVINVTSAIETIRVRARERLTDVDLSTEFAQLWSPANGE